MQRSAERGCRQRVRGGVRGGVQRGCGGGAERHLGHELEEGAEVGVVDDLGLELSAVEGGQRAERTVGRHVLRESAAEGHGGAKVVQRGAHSQSGCRAGAERVQSGATGQATGGVRRRWAVQR